MNGYDPYGQGIGMLQQAGQALGQLADQHSLSPAEKWMALVRSKQLTPYQAATAARVEQGGTAFTPEQAQQLPPQPMPQMGVPTLAPGAAPGPAPAPASPAPAGPPQPGSTGFGGPMPQGVGTLAQGGPPAPAPNIPGAPRSPYPGPMQFNEQPNVQAAGTDRVRNQALMLQGLAGLRPPGEDAPQPTAGSGGSDGGLGAMGGGMYPGMQPDPTIPPFPGVSTRRDFNELMGMAGTQQAGGGVGAIAKETLRHNNRMSEQGGKDDAALTREQLRARTKLTGQAAGIDASRTNSDNRNKMSYMQLVERAREFNTTAGQKNPWFTVLTTAMNNVARIRSSLGQLAHNAEVTAAAQNYQDLVTALLTHLQDKAGDMNGYASVFNADPEVVVQDLANDPEAQSILQRMLQFIPWIQSLPGMPDAGAAGAPAPTAPAAPAAPAPSRKPLKPTKPARKFSDIK